MPFAALFLAAAVSLPFKPPEGWDDMTTDVPQAEVLAAWKGPHNGNADQWVHVVTAPFVGTVDSMVGKMILTDTGVLGMRMASQRPGMMCNAPARFLTMTKNVDTGQIMIEQAMFVLDNKNYLVTYGRDANQPEDADMEQIIGALCPGTVAATSLALPAGWSDLTAQGAHTDGKWQGKSVGQSMNLVSQPYNGSLESLSINALKETASAKALISVLSQKPGTLCGMPAYFVNAKVRLAGMEVYMQQEAVISSGKAYILTYGRFQDQQDDPAALRSLKTLCPRNTGAK